MTEAASLAGGHEDPQVLEGHTIKRITGVNLSKPKD